MEHPLIRALTTGLLILILWLPAWWIAGRLPSGRHDAPFRLMISIGIATVGYLSFVNLLGRVIENSIASIISPLLLGLTPFVTKFSISETSPLAAALNSVRAEETCIKLRNDMKKKTPRMIARVFISLDIAASFE